MAQSASSGERTGRRLFFITQPEAGWQKTLVSCKNIAEPRVSQVTGEEMAQHLIGEYGAYQVPVSKGKRIALKMSVLINHHSEALSKPPMPPESANREAWQAWAEQAQLGIEAAREIPDEQYGLRYRFFAVPHTEKTERFYEEAEREFPQPPKRF